MRFFFTWAFGGQARTAGALARRRIIVYTLGLALLACACAKDPTKQDLRDYLEDIARLDALEDDITAAENDLNEILKKSPPDTQAALKLVNERMIPKSQEILAEARKIHPKTADVKSLHERYVKATETRLDGMTRWSDGIAKNDNALAMAGRQKIEESNRIMQDFVTAGIELGKKHHVKTER